MINLHTRDHREDIVSTWELDTFEDCSYSKLYKLVYCITLEPGHLED